MTCLWSLRRAKELMRALAVSAHRAFSVHRKKKIKLPNAG